jgi:hypothetical protein
MMVRFVLFWSMVLLLAACDDGRDASQRPEVGVESTTAADELPGAPEEPNAAQQANEQAAPTQETGDIQEPAQEPVAGITARDLGAELRAAVGSPVDCLQDYRPSNTTSIRVDISAIVRPSGVVIEPSANGRGLSANDRGCIERRVGDVVLAPFDSSASQPVSTYLELAFQAPDAKEVNVGARTPELKDVVEAQPKKPTIPRSGTPIETAPFDRPDGPKGVPIEGPKGDKISGPKPKPIDGYEVEEDSEVWTDD